MCAYNEANQAALDDEADADVELEAELEGAAAAVVVGEALQL